jgi:hypothetical protein
MMKTYEITINNNYQDTHTTTNGKMNSSKYLFMNLSGYDSREKIINTLVEAIKDMKIDAERLRKDWNTRLAIAGTAPNRHVILINELDRDVSRAAYEQGDAIASAMRNWNLARISVMHEGCTGAENREGYVTTPVFDQNIIQQMATTGMHDSMIGTLITIPKVRTDKSYTSK